jgi:glucoamylase
MPLVWAHAEFIKLAASRALGRPFDRPDAVWCRYGGKRPNPAHAIWTPRFEIAQIRAGQTLCLLLPRAARVHYGVDGWQRIGDAETEDSGLMQCVAQLPTATLPAGSHVDFTLFWTDTKAWEGNDHRIDIH